MSREHNNANAIALRGRNFDAETNRELLAIWLDTEFTSDPRHERRIGKIMDIERC
jgi:ribose 5-phosphate isomerase B